MPSSPTIIVKLRSAHPKMIWGIYVPDENRWLDFLFHRELEARQFAKDLVKASAAA